MSSVSGSTPNTSTYLDTFPLMPLPDLIPAFIRGSFNSPAVNALAPLGTKVITEIAEKAGREIAILMANCIGTHRVVQWILKPDASFTLVLSKDSTVGKKIEGILRVNQILLKEGFIRFFPNEGLFRVSELHRPFFTPENQLKILNISDTQRVT